MSELAEVPHSVCIIDEAVVRFVRAAASSYYGGWGWNIRMVLDALFSASADAEKGLSAGRNRKEGQCVLHSSGRFDSAVFPSVSFPHDVLRCAISLVWRIADTRHGCGGVPDESEWLDSAVLRSPGYPTLASLP